LLGFAGFIGFVEFIGFVGLLGFVGSLGYLVIESSAVNKFHAYGNCKRGGHWF
jgi:hypothetical protein